MKRLFCALLVLMTLPAWAGTIGIDIGDGGKVVFKEAKGPVWGGGKVVDFAAGTNSVPVVNAGFSFVTGHLTGLKPSEWLYGAGGRVSFSGCLDVDSDGDKTCHKDDFRGKLFTGQFLNATIRQTGKNTFTLTGQLWLTPMIGLVNAMGVKNAPFVANISLKFTDTCAPSCSASVNNLLSGKVVATAPEPTSFVLLGLGMLLAGLGHTTLLSFFRPHV